MLHSTLIFYTLFENVFTHSTHPIILFYPYWSQTESKKHERGGGKREGVERKK